MPQMHRRADQQAVMSLKVVVTGAFNAGKSTFIRTISTVPPVLTEELTFGGESAVKRSTTVALDYGRAVTEGGLLLHLFGTPGQARFSFMREVLAQGMDAFVMVVDSTDSGALYETQALLDAFARLPNAPYVIAATKGDLPGALRDDELRRYLHVEAPIMACDARSRASVQAVLEALLTLPSVAAAGA